MKTIVSAALVMAALGGCTMPDQPSDSMPDAALVVNAHFEHDALVFDVTGDGWFQVLLDTDDRPDTGWGSIGAEIEMATDLDVRGDSCAVRQTQPPDPSSPNGWGVATGWAVTHGIGRREREMRIPLSSLGQTAQTVCYQVWLESDVRHHYSTTGSVAQAIVRSVTQ